MKISHLNGKKILLLGFGLEGQATYNFLRSEFPTMNLGIADKMEQHNFSAHIQEVFQSDTNLIFHFGQQYLDSLEQYDLICKSPGISPRLPQIQTAVKKGIPITSATNLFFSLVQGEVIGVTGSKGKSTTATLLFEVLHAAGKDVELIGNIGKPALEVLPSESPEKIYVYELSSYQLEDIAYSPHIGIITSLFPDHLDYHGDLQSYFGAKMNLGKYMSDQDILFYNAAFSKISELTKGFSAKIISYNNDEESTIADGWLEYTGEQVVNTQDIPLKGRHNWQNILGVIAVAKEYHISNDIIAEAIRNFEGLEHRLEHVGQFHGIDFYNDAIATTPEATIAALNSFPKVHTLIVGGLDRGYDFQKLAREIVQKKISEILIFPDTGARIQQEVILYCQKQNFSPPHFHPADDMKSCVQKAYQVTPPEKICLLSPASPSYNAFTNFQEKGNEYKKCVKEFS